MAIYDIFSKRQKRLRGEVSDVYIYDEIPQPLRVQIVHIWHASLGNSSDYKHEFKQRVFGSYKFIVDTLCREYGIFTLIQGENCGIRNYLMEFCVFVLQEQSTERILDAIELSFQVIDQRTREYDYALRQDASKRADAAIAELNARFKEHGVGFQFIEGKIVRVDSEFIHAEVVKPALALLHGREYAGAQSEFLKAHEHYRHGNAKEALTECLKALESTMKAICDKHKWQCDPNATCSKLIEVCFDKDLIPKFWVGHFSALRSTLESGVPPARNKLSGHGQGSTVVDVSPHIVAYVLHMTAACIVFLVESEQALA